MIERIEDLEERLAAVLALHQVAYKAVEPWAAGYRFTGKHCALDGAPWPCVTARAAEPTL